MKISVKKGPENFETNHTLTRPVVVVCTRVVESRRLGLHPPVKVLVDKFEGHLFERETRVETEWICEKRHDVCPDLVCRLRLVEGGNIEYMEKWHHEFLGSVASRSKTYPWRLEVGDCEDSD